MGIPKVPPIPEKLLKILSSGKLVFFLGAGVSRLLNYPSWAELADRSLGQLINEPEINFTHADSDILKYLNPRQKLSIAIEIWEEKDYKRKKLIKRAIRPVGSRSTKVFEILAEINVPFVTTNYDDCLIDVAIENPILATNEGEVSSAEELGRRKRRIISSKKDFLTTALQKTDSLIYLHGRLKDDSPMVITTKDYVDHYRDKFLREFLDHLFDKYHVLFIGYGLDEEEIIDFIVRKKPINNQVSHFRLIPAYSHEERLMGHLGKYYRNQCQVELVPYLIDIDGHKQLENVLDNWLPAIKDLFQPLNFLERTKMILDPVIKNGISS